jgi:large subunit ribosomal protein L7/L12
MNKELLIDTLSNMPSSEMALLVEDLKSKWGVTLPTAQVQVQKQEVVEEEQTEFTVKLSSFAADKKMAVIKAIRAATGLGLKEAKEMAESVPKVLKESISKEEVDELKAAFAESEATLTVE